MGEVQQVSHADEVCRAAQRIGSAGPGAGDCTLRGREPKAREQLQYGCIDLFDPSAIDDDGAAVDESRQQQAAQTGCLDDRHPGIETNRLRGANSPFFAHAAAAPGTGSPEMLLPMSRSISSKMSIFSSTVASALTNTVSMLPQTSGGGMASAALTL